MLFLSTKLGINIPLSKKIDLKKFNITFDKSILVPESLIRFEKLERRLKL